MRFAISLLNFRAGRIGGAETYMRGLVAGLARVKQPDEEVILVTHRDNDVAIRVEGVRTVCIDRSDRQIILARLLEAWTPYRARFAEWAFAAVKADVVLFPQQSIFPKRFPGRCVLTVHDIQHLILPGNISLAERLFRRGIYPYSLRRADHVLAISEFTRQMLLEHCGVPGGRTTAVLSGFEPPPDALPAKGTRANDAVYVYYPAATWPHKNHATLFRTVAVLRQAGMFPYRLVLTGLQTGEWKRLRRLKDELGLAQVVTHEGFVPRDRVAQLYRGAAAILIPSLFEGFGLPVLEAVAYDKKTIVSPLPVFQEFGVPKEWQIDFAQPDQLLAALERPGPTQLEKTPQTWEDCARATLAVLRHYSRG